jgi:formylglycine-generating enzyme required for sulfatase activity
MTPMTSPFKFLDSYKQEDGEIFFGREKETNDLYQALSGVKHLLVYGPSGAGKTSLVECGLRNQFSDADWYALTIRRGADMVASVFNTINDALREKITLDPKNKRPLDPDTDFGHAIENLFSERYQPVYLLFDQFEELLISGSEDEKKDFFKRLNQLIRYKVPCRVMLIMREEFIGHLSEFEPLCPSIFQHRFRVEKMRKENVKSVIRETLDAPHFQEDFQVDDSEALAESILSKLPDKSREIELAHVQVFLSELWDRAAEEKSKLDLPRLHVGLIRTDDNLAGVLESFLKKQLDELDKTYGDKVPLETLAAMISERHTKLQVSADDLQKDLADKGVALQRPLEELLHDLEKRRILRTLKSGEQTQYEISHDVLALVVGNNLTREMEMRAKAADIYRVYEERKGFFSQEDLDLIRPYQQYKSYPPELEQRIQESEAHLHAEALRMQREQEERFEEAQRQAEQERQLREESEKQRTIAQENEARARTRTRLALVVSLIALILALFAGWSYNQAEIKTKETADALKKVEQEKAATEEQRRIAEKKTKEAEANFKLAEDNLKKAQAEEARAIAALEQVKKEKTATEEQRRIAEDNLEKAKTAREDAERQKTIAQNTLDNLNKANEAFVLRFLENARKDMADARYDDAYDKIQAAGGLGVLKAEVCKAYIANADSCLLDPDSSKYEIANQSVAAAASIGALEPLEIGNAYVRIAQNCILNLQYNPALKFTQAAEALKVVHPDTIKNLYLEAAFWYTGSGNTQRSAGILDTLTARLGYAAARQLLQNLPADSTEAVSRLREVLQKIDAGQYERLRRRYYPVMVKIPGGKFMMGCDKAKDPDCQDNETLHEQEVRSFEMASTETTVWQFALFCAATGWKIDSYIEWPNSGDNPVVKVGWYDAVEYANWVSRQRSSPEAYDINREVLDTLNTGEFDVKRWMVKSVGNSGYRLPTEAEWEYAAGGGVGTRTKYAGTNEVEQLEDVAWYRENSGSRTRSVGIRKANPLGLYDMSGNVWEWCWDWYGDYLTDQKPDYKGPDTGRDRVSRGGSWSGGPRGCRVSYRGGVSPDGRSNDFGFRLARTP